MPVITIPFDYTETTHPTIIPICIADTDAKGNPVHRGWIEHGVVPVVDGLVKIAARVLFDKSRASEITEYAVHSLNRRFGEDIGDHPDVLVLNRARHHAVDLRAGGRRARRRLDVELFVETLDALEEQYDAARHLVAIDTVEKIVEHVDLLGLNRVKELVPSMLENTEGHELSSRFGQKRNTITKRFYRGMRKAADVAGISWGSSTCGEK